MDLFFSFVIPVETGIQWLWFWIPAGVYPALDAGQE